MIPLRSSLVVAGLSLALNARADLPPVPPIPGSTNAPDAPANLLPPVNPPVSPVALFRRLLSLNSREREAYLTNRPPAIRAGLLAKLKEYQAMDPDTRELRLRATELRWQLLPLLRLPPPDRAPLLARVPDDLAPLVRSRLADWDQLPAHVQAEFLENERTLHYFALVATNQPGASDPAAEARRQTIAARFNQFFELTPEEKQRTLKTLSTAERAQMAATLQAYAKLTPVQRRQCLHAFDQFAGLSPAERAEFLHNAERWAQMSPRERQIWRDLVAHVPQWPPLPMPASPALLPSPPPERHRATMATN